MKLTKKDLNKLIVEEINKLEEYYQGDDQDAQPESEEPAQQYIDWIVAIDEAARKTLEEIERGEEPYKAALRSGLNQLAFGLTDEDFYHHYFGQEKQ